MLLLNLVFHASLDRHLRWVVQEEVSPITRKNLKQFVIEALIYRPPMNY